MAKTMTPEEVTQILTSLRENKSINRGKVIKELLVETQKNRVAYTTLNISDLFSTLSAILETSNVNDVVESLHLISEITNLFPLESKDNLHLILNNLVLLLTDDQAVKRKMSASVLAVYLKKTDDTERIFDAILNEGFESQEVENKGLLIPAFTQIALAKPSISFASESFKKIFETILGEPGSNPEEHQKSVQEMLRALMKGDKARFQAFVQTLTPELQEHVFELYKNDPNAENQNEYEEPQDQDEEKEDHAHQYHQQSQDSREQAEQQSQKQREKLTFSEKAANFLNPRVIQNAQDENDWKIRAVAVEEISKTFEAFLDSKPEQQDLISFTKLMLRLINDQNFKIAVTTLQILPQAFSQLEDDELIALSDELIVENVNKFCDSKEIIRNIAAQNLHQLMQRCYAGSFIKPLQRVLQEKSWHTREEALLFAEQLITEKGGEIPPEKYTPFIRQIISLLSDPRQKVKNQAIKTLGCVLKTSDEDDPIAQLVRTETQPQLYSYLTSLTTEKHGLTLKAGDTSFTNEAQELIQGLQPQYFPTFLAIQLICITLQWEEHIKWSSN